MTFFIADSARSGESLAVRTAFRITPTFLLVLLPACLNVREEPVDAEAMDGASRGGANEAPSGGTGGASSNGSGGAISGGAGGAGGGSASGGGDGGAIGGGAGGTSAGGSSAGGGAISAGGGGAGGLAGAGGAPAGGAGNGGAGGSAPADANLAVDTPTPELLQIEKAWPWGGDFDTAVVWPNGSAYFFRGAEYQRINPTTGAQTLATSPITKYWPNWPADFASGIDAAVDLHKGKAFFFKGDQVGRYDIAADRMDDGYPHPIATEFPGLPTAFAAKVDAIAIWPENGPLSDRAFIFTGTDYVRYARDTGKPDSGYPLKTSSYWKGFPASWPKTTLALVWPGGKVFFKYGDQYIRYDIAADKADPGYPRSFK